MVEVARCGIGWRDLAINPKGFNALGQRGLICDDRSAVAITSKRLGREEAGGCNIGPVGGVLAVECATKALRCIGNQLQVELIAYRLDFRVICRLPEQVNSDHDFRLQLAFLDRPFDFSAQG